MRQHAPEVVCRARELREQGATTQEIAVGIGVPLSTVQSWVRPNPSRPGGVDRRREPRPRLPTVWTGQAIAHALYLRSTGATVAAIATEMGRSYSAVRHALRLAHRAEQALREAS